MDDNNINTRGKEKEEEDHQYSNMNNNNSLLYGDVFDKIEDLLDFSDEEMQMLMEVEPAPATTTVDVPPTALPGPFLDDHSSSAPPTNDTDHFPPCDHDLVDAAELEWLSNFVEESFSHRRSCTTSTIPPPHTNHQVVVDPSTLIMKKVQYRRRTPSPISVLLGHGGEGGQQSSTTFSSTSSSSSPTSSSCCSSISNPLPIRAPRTKRTRPSTSLSKDDDSLLLLIPNFAESNPILQPHNNNNNITSSSPTNTKFKKLKIISSASASASAPVSTTVPVPVRKCMHCEIQKTPQWRAGPMGPKTLCNACGVRYKSGRLFPEYRPAASPTFIASHHSNSHKKVIEMRVKSTQEKEKEVLPPALPVSVKACELFNYINTN